MEISLAYFVSTFIFTILLWLNLNSIICKMNAFVIDVIWRNGIFKWTCSYISFLIEIASKLITIYYLGQSKHSNVKFSFGGIEPIWSTYKQRFFYILLYYPVLITCLLQQEFLSFLHIFTNLYILASIRIFTRF